jgi:glycosyltransferase involved in cell wall biosynthesis
MLRYATKHARLIITDSEHSKLDLIKYFQLPAEKIRVIFPAADKKCHFTSNADISRSQIMRKYGIVQPYILYVGKHHAYKNIPTLLHAYMHYREVFEHFQLVIAGKRDVRQQVLYETAALLDSGNRIIFTDFVSEDDLFALYKGASLFVFPSRYEGFGLPPLEAMACGVPVITSNAASLPEVVEDAGIQVDPLDHHKLADAIKKVLTERSLWKTMRQKGLSQVQKFSWERAAQQVAQIYHRVAISQ